VTNRFGRHLFNIFFKTYTEKVWGIPCSEIRAEWAAQRIQGLSLFSVIKNALISQNKKNKNTIKTLIDKFDYPKFGPGMMWNAVSEIITTKGSQMLLGAEVETIRWANNSIEALEVKRNGGTEILYGTDFISSMPLREIINKIEPAAPDKIIAAANNLQYRDFLTVALIIDKKDVFPDNWIYVHDPNVKVGRIQNFKNWSPYMVPDHNKTFLGLEYFCFEGDSLWMMPDEDLISLATNEIENLNFAKKKEVLDGTVVRMPKAYPVYDSKYRNSIEVIKQFLAKAENLHLVGRNGQHKYNNQDHSMLTAMMAAENVLGAKHDLWQVNEEPEYHEEIVVKVLKRTFARIDKLGFATALASISGLLVFLATIILVFKGGQVVGPRLQLLNQFFIGYSVSVKGAFIGMVQSFLWAFLFGWLTAYLRNFFSAYYIYRLKKIKEFLTFQDFMDHF
jgi:protoporphyrinogen oxidase